MRSLALKMQTIGFISISSYQGLHNIMYQKTVIFTVIAAKMSNITSVTQLLFPAVTASCKGNEYENQNAHNFRQLFMWHE